MERVDPSGERREADPAEVAQYDQMEAHFTILLKQILATRDRVLRGAEKDDTAAIAAATKDLEDLVKREFPDGKPTEINFIMFLIGMVEHATEWTQHSFDVVEDSLRMLANVVRPTHPLRRLPGWEAELLDKERGEVQAALDAIHGSDQTFTTDTGVELVSVHPEGKCEGQFCVVHNPAPGPWDGWETNWREDWRLMTRICPHAVEHPAMEEILRMPLLGLIAHEHPGGCDCPCDLSRCHPVDGPDGKLIGFRPASL